MHIMQGISLTDSQSPPQFTSSMVLSSTGAPRKSLKPPESVQIKKKSNVHRSVGSKLDHILL